MKIDIKHIAKLANLNLNQEEEEKFDRQLNGILEYVKKIEEIDVTNVTPTSQVTGLENITRYDNVPTPSLTQDEATSGTYSKHNGLFKVKQLIDGE
ncbi:MAG TPA: Asp-tRNA(Asn)/Glu-tRNA(Gln) amidotransferase subunit GatC [Candidatus Levybacteria bacterium]|nr:Asp-tRNA(Asn)/Glu-tRNA(Gln) amidotransferase subunit GatC [Candidatus Levybacteria bacterium]